MYPRTMLRRSAVCLSFVIATAHGDAQANSARSGIIFLPLVLSPDDAAKVPMTKVDADTLIGARSVGFQSVAHVSSPVRVNIKKPQTEISPNDTLIEYKAKVDGETFFTYCKTFNDKPLLGLICLADRDQNGKFDQFWLGHATRNEIGIPYPIIRLQSSPVDLLYSVDKGPISTNIKFGFSVTSAGGFANKRQIILQFTNGVERSSINYDLISGPGKRGPVDTTVFDAELRLYGEDSKTVTYSIEKPWMLPVYDIQYPGDSQTIFIYTP